MTIFSSLHTAYMALPRFQLNSLKARIILLVLGIVLLAFLAMAAFVKGLMQDQLLVFAGEQQRSVLRLLTSEVKRGLEERFQALKKAAVSTLVLPFDSAQAVQQLLSQNAYLTDVFNGGVKVWDAQGGLMSDAPEKTDDLGGSVVDPKDLAEVLGTGKEHVGRVLLLQGGKLAAFSLLVPLHNARGQVKGVLGGVVRLDRPNFLSQMTAHTYGQTGNLFLLDARQRLIFATSDSNRQLEVLPAPGVSPWIDRFVQGFEGTARVVNPHGVEVLVSIAQIPLAHWYASVTLTPQEAFALIDAIKWPSRLVGSVLLILSIGLIGWLLRRQFGPMTAALAALNGFVRDNQPPQALPIVRPDEIGQLVGGFNLLLDTLAHQQQALQGSQMLKQSVLNSVTAAIAVLDVQGRILMTNSTWLQLAPDTGVGKNYLSTVQALEASAASTPPLAPVDGIRAVLQGNLPRYYTECDCHTRQERVWHSITVTPLQGKVTQGAVVSIEDINQRVQMQEQVKALAFYDVLTGLPNRRLVLERLSQQLVQSRRGKTRLGLMFIDQDHFKPINDELGHDVGDWLLRCVASRLQGCLRESDTAARLGGDEFLALLPEVQDAAAALGVAEKIRTTLAQEFITDQGVVLQISSSIGVAIYPDHARTDKDLLRMGDEAMYRAKRRGRNAVEMCEETLPGSATQAAGAASEPQTPSRVHLRWKAAFNSGHPQIDQQHQQLFTLANALLDASAQRHEQMDSFDTAFLQLLAHVMEHFSLEESVLKSAGYAGLADHAKEHQALVVKAQALYAAAQTDESDALAHDKLVKFLVNELVAAHLLQRDREFFSTVAKAA